MELLPLKGEAVIHPTQGGDLRGPLSWALNLGARLAMPQPRPCPTIIGTLDTRL